MYLGAAFARLRIRKDLYEHINAVASPEIRNFWFRERNSNTFSDIFSLFSKISYTFSDFGREPYRRSTPSPRYWNKTMLPTVISREIYLRKVGRNSVILKTREWIQWESHLSSHAAFLNKRKKIFNLLLKLNFRKIYWVFLNQNATQNYNFRKQFSVGNNN